ncbi:putative tpr domain containing protein [Phaeoacremonium minimum UCRPA7]|uniref:Putative tpr domain containing protein n=1 Tax=Phaeoacremonium minimum (strain UCR-PA7) TaxID=1286976 RepID=R8BKZ5_PHAM7|nr:putative tpr domain containing protein [Phaeoacremonium minimum UCRPA7]EOO00043.1 putative tpr domain containing protein [Phaeoacremonium minimum UCRPA7]
MSDEREKKGGFWDLFRSKTTTRRGSRLEKEPPRRASEGDAASRRRRTSEGPDRVTSTRRRPRRPISGDAKGKGREGPNGAPYDTGPLTEWPPSGFSSEEELTLGHAMELISRGVPAHKGHKRPIPHASESYYALFATTAGNRGDDTDTANQHDSMTQLMTLRIQGPGSPTYPWETLEQPSYSFYFGKRPGTVTLNQWTTLSSKLPPVIALRDPGVMPREVDLEQVFRRLKELEAGLEDDDDDLMYRNLYKRLLRDPDKIMNPHRTLDKQITDLIMVLSRPDWFDFTNPRNQIVTKFIFDTGHTNHQQYLKFFHQLLLSLELDLRINSRHHNDWSKEKLLQQLPPRLQWNLALSRRWRDNVRVETYGKTAGEVKLRFKLKRRQIKMIKRFAQMMKWPNLHETLDTLKRRDTDSTLDGISSHAMAFFSGLVLPGTTFPFLLMNSLIDIDPDKATDDLALLTHLHPLCGFQYRNSYTYWTSMSIVGKVLAPTCHEIAGWVGPARPTVDLGRSQIARIRTRQPRQRMTAEDVATMSERSDPLGPPTEVFPVKEYTLVVPDTDEIVDTVRIELLTLRPCADRNASNEPADAPRWFDASIQFAIDGVSWPLRLAYDVSFVCAWPCSDGPHPLFFDYTYMAVKADEITGIRDWAGLYGGSSKAGSKSGKSASDLLSARSSPAVGLGPSKAKTPIHSDLKSDDDDDEKVLVIEAFGVADNEVLARAWCAHWGLSAVVADIGKTW